MDPDEIIERGRNVQEMETSLGYKALKIELEREISDQELMLKQIETDGRRPEDIGADYIARIQRVAGLRRTFEIIESMKEDAQREQAKDTTA